MLSRTAEEGKVARDKKRRRSLTGSSSPASPEMRYPRQPCPEPSPATPSPSPLLSLAMKVASGRSFDVAARRWGAGPLGSTPTP